MRNCLIVAGIATLLVVAGCGKSGEEAAKAPASGSSGGLKPDVASGAKIAGKVTFTGAKPELRPIDMSANPACQKAHPSPVASEEVVVNNGSLANVFVWVKDGVPEGKWAAPATPAVVDQQGCIYKPHVSGVVDWSDRRVPEQRRYQSQHPSVASRRTKSGMSPSRRKAIPRTKTFEQEEVMIPVKCNIHPWMRAYIGAVRHPFFAVTGEDGSFSIAGLPPGKYTVEAWHERFGKQDVEVTVAAKDSKSVDFTFSDKAAAK